MKLTKVFLVFVAVMLATGTSHAQRRNGDVIIVGEMKNVMWKGQLYGSIILDTIAKKEHLYGFGPVEYLSGEILIVDGVAYKSTVFDDTSMMVEQTYEVEAPFFAYANIYQWKEIPLPKEVKSLPQLETFLHEQTLSVGKPYFFKLSGIAEQAKIHVVNLPKGARVNTPDDAHLGRKSYELVNREVDIIGFFSTAHQTIFTHKDSYLHMHLLTKDKYAMGYLDELLFEEGAMKLYLSLD